MRATILLIIFLICNCYNLSAQKIIVKEKSEDVFAEYMQDMLLYKELPINVLIIKTAMFFLNKPYTESTLDIDTRKEQLVVNLTEFDCTTFVENCVALALTLKSYDKALAKAKSSLSDSRENIAFKSFCSYLQLLRYRNGEIDGYASRLHYMTDWIYNAVNNDLIDDLSISFGGVRLSKQINFMSSNAHYYKQLIGNNTNLLEIKRVEDNINHRDSYSIIPKRNVRVNIDSIKNGDIILFATSVEGLDYSHVGIAYKTEDKLSFIHASSKYRKIVIETQKLEDYCLGYNKNIGISILRLK